MINSENHITLENINYSVNNKSFFKNLSTNISTNGITIILGPNGSGKTTTIGKIAKQEKNNGKRKDRHKNI